MKQSHSEGILSKETMFDYILMENNKGSRIIKLEGVYNHNPTILDPWSSGLPIHPF